MSNDVHCIKISQMCTICQHYIQRLTNNRIYLISNTLLTLIKSIDVLVYPNLDDSHKQQERISILMQVQVFNEYLKGNAVVITRRAPIACNVMTLIDCPNEIINAGS